MTNAVKPSTKVSIIAKGASISNIFGENEIFPINEELDTTKRSLKTQLPTMPPSTRSLLFLNAATKVVTISGKDDPIAIKVTEIILSDIAKYFALPIPPLTKKYAPDDNITMLTKMIIINLKRLSNKVPKLAIKIN